MRRPCSYCRGTNPLLSLTSLDGSLGRFSCIAIVRDEVWAISDHLPGKGSRACSAYTVGPLTGRGQSKALLAPGSAAGPACLLWPLRPLSFVLGTEKIEMLKRGREGCSSHRLPAGACGPSMTCTSFLGGTSCIAFPRGLLAVNGCCLFHMLSDSCMHWCRCAGRALIQQEIVDDRPGRVQRIRCPGQVLSSSKLTG